MATSQIETVRLAKQFPVSSDFIQFTNGFNRMYLELYKWYEINKEDTINGAVDNNPDYVSLRTTMNNSGIYSQQVTDLVSALQVMHDKLVELSP